MNAPKNFIDFMVEAETRPDLIKFALQKHTAEELQAYFLGEGYTVDLADCQKLLGVKDFALGIFVDLHVPGEPGHVGY
jgi:hypothetical protein